MPQLSFSQSTLVFTYAAKSHLKTSLLLQNPSTSPAFFKFKLTRPKFYFIKPEKAFIKPGQQIPIEVTIHGNGIEEAHSDKIKCFYTFVERVGQEIEDGFDKKDTTQSQKFTIQINNLPPELMNKVPATPSSQLKSHMSSSSRFALPALSYEASVRQKENKLASLKSEVQSLKSQSIASSNSIEGDVTTAVGWLAIVLGGLTVGVISSFFI